jgi:hypothetical protein
MQIQVKAKATREGGQKPNKLIPELLCNVLEQ